MVLFIILAVTVVAMLGSFVYAFAVYALPAFAGLWVAKLAVHHGIGLVGSALIGILLAGAVWGVGQGVFEVVRSARVRLAVAALYAAPAAFAGYEVVHGLLKPHVADIGPVLCRVIRCRSANGSRACRPDCAHGRRSPVVEVVA